MGMRYGEIREDRSGVIQNQDAPGAAVVDLAGDSDVAGMPAAH